MKKNKSSMSSLGKSEGTSVGEKNSRKISVQK